MAARLTQTYDPLLLKQSLQWEGAAPVPQLRAAPVSSGGAPAASVRAVLAALDSSPQVQPQAPQNAPAGNRPPRNQHGPRSTLVVGDSLGVGTVPELKRILKGRVDANVEVGRNSASGIQALKQALSQRDYGRIVLDLGTNDGSVQELAQSLRRARRLAGDTPLLAATVRGPNAAAKNRLLRRSGVELLDWAGVSDPYVGSDGIHASPAGYARRARLMARALRALA